MNTVNKYNQHKSKAPWDPQQFLRIQRGPETKKFENIRRKALEKVMAVLCSLHYQGKVSVLRPKCLRILGEKPWEKGHGCVVQSSLSG